MATAVDDPPTLIKPVLTLTVAEGQTTLPGLYSQLLANVNDVDFGGQAKLTISTIGQSNTMGFLNFDPTDHLLTYTASGFNAKQPTDSFTYTVQDPYGPGSVTGRVDVTVTGPNLPTLVGTTVTANGSHMRLIGTNSPSKLLANGSGEEIFGGHGNDTITANGDGSVIYGGPGTNTIKLNGSPQTVVLEQGGLDKISGFQLGSGDVLDLKQVLAESQIDLGGDFSKLASYFSVSTSGSNATISFDPQGVGAGPGAALAVLNGAGAHTTLNTLINDGSFKIG